jgi:hypothetical protein
MFWLRRHAKFDRTKIRPQRDFDGATQHFRGERRSALLAQRSD